jgi:hypothetical protein
MAVSQGVVRVMRANGGTFRPLPMEGDSMDRLQPLRDIDREFQTYREFWKKYALGDLTIPSCLGCGQPTQVFGIRHMELHGVGLCGRCTLAVRDSARSGDEKRG